MNWMRVLNLMGYKCRLIEETYKQISVGMVCTVSVAVIAFACGSNHIELRNVDYTAQVQFFISMHRYVQNLPYLL